MVMMKEKDVEKIKKHTIGFTDVTGDVQLHNEFYEYCGTSLKKDSVQNIYALSKINDWCIAEAIYIKYKGNNQRFIKYPYNSSSLVLSKENPIFYNLSNNLVKNIKPFHELLSKNIIINKEKYSSNIDEKIKTLENKLTEIIVKQSGLKDFFNKENQYFRKYNVQCISVVLLYGPLKYEDVLYSKNLKKLINTLPHILLFKPENCIFIVEVNYMMIENKKNTLNDIRIRCLINSKFKSAFLQEIYIHPLSATGGRSMYRYTHDILHISNISQRDVQQFIARQLQTQLQKNVFRLPIISQKHRDTYFHRFSVLNVDLIDLKNSALYEQWGVKKNLFNQKGVYILSCVELDTGICAARWIKHKKTEDVNKALEGILVEYCVLHGMMLYDHLTYIITDEGKEFNDIQYHFPGITVRRNMLRSNAHVENINKLLCRVMFRKYILIYSNNVKDYMRSYDDLNYVLQMAVDNVNNTYSYALIKKFNLDNINVSPFSFNRQYLVHPSLKDMLYNPDNSIDAQHIRMIRDAGSFLSSDNNEFSIMGKKVQSIIESLKNVNVQQERYIRIQKIENNINIYNSKKQALWIRESKLTNYNKNLPVVKDLSLVRVLLDDGMGATYLQDLKEGKKIKEKMLRIKDKNFRRGNIYKGYRSHWSYIPYIVLRKIYLNKHRLIYLVWPYVEFSKYMFIYWKDNKKDNDEPIEKKQWIETFMKKKKNMINKKDENWIKEGPWKKYFEMTLKDISNGYRINNIQRVADKWRFRDEIQEISIHTNQSAILSPLTVNTENEKRILEPLYIQMSQWQDIINKGSIQNVPSYNVDWNDNEISKTQKEYLSI